MKKIIELSFILVITSMSAMAQSVPGSLSYQGILLDENGVPKPDKTAGYSVTFYFYDVETGGTALEVRGPFTIHPQKGLFTLILGDGSSGNAALPATLGDAQMWLGIKVDSDPELIPRVKFTSVPYAFRAENANKAALATDVETGKVVKSINNLKDAVTISAGSNITLTPSGNDLQISAPASLVNKVNNISGDVTIASGTNVSVNNAGNTITISATGSGGIAGSGTSGYVTFWDAPSSVSSNSNLFWDNTNSRLGIGTGTPAQRLDVSGTVNATAFTGALSASYLTGSNNLPNSVLSTNLQDLAADGQLSAASLSGSNNLPNSVLSANLQDLASDGQLSAASLSGTNNLPNTVLSANLQDLASDGQLSAASLSGTNNLPNTVLSTNLQDLAGDGQLSAANLSGSNNLPNSVLSSNLQDLAGDGQLSAASLSGTNNLPSSVLDADIADLADGTLNMAGYLTTVGGLHVGGTSDPGTDNLVVDGNANISGTITGSGSGLSNLNASSIASGTISDSRLETNVDVAGSLTTVNGLHVGGAGAPGVDNLEVDGFTKMGAAPPAGAGGSAVVPQIKTVRMTGTTSGSASGTVGINHGLTSSKILNVSVMVEHTAGNFIPGYFIYSAGYYFNWYITPTQIVIANVDTANPLFSSTSIRSKNFVVLITYEQ